MRERDSTMATMRQYDDDSATIRWRQCVSTMAKMRERDSTMTTMRQCDDDSAKFTKTTVQQYNGYSAIVRWRQSEKCDGRNARTR
ncbi:hypothetical protein DPMN_021363 [Dreissena polymorpha]|uniref:Uncharacterized protein n=1 Tax=Dreissena polymorpha TaxID=45954 RepID=A0A9D4SAZ0_DREPO|nr:hypothetical protein DPMN_021363 [Dreissena polymorpha]